MLARDHRDHFNVADGTGAHAAFQFGGPNLVIKTLQANFPPLRINHYVEVDFDLSDAAVAAAAKAFTTWSRVPVADRAALVAKVSAIIRDRRDEFSATMVVEAGKTWGEADADAAESVDFCELYLRDAIRLSGPQPVAHRPGPHRVDHSVTPGCASSYPPSGPGAHHRGAA